MTPRPLGRTGLSAAPLMLGGNVFGWTADREASFAVLDAFVEAGGSLIDTADIYCAFVPGFKGGESETMIGEWLAARRCRDKVLIATKVGLLPGAGGSGLSASRIAGTVDESLARLQTDVIDIYFAHIDDRETPLEESLEAFDKLVRAGKVRHLAASNFTPERLEEALAISDAHGWARFAVIEPCCNLIQPEGFSGAMQELALREGLGVVPFYALANGVLTGKYRSVADAAGHAREEWLPALIANPRTAPVLAAMDRISAETGAELASIAIAWLIARKGVSAPIASASKPSQVPALIAAATLSLTPEQLALLDAASAGVPA